MNSNTVLNDEMSLDEKLAAIDAAMQTMQDAAKAKAESLGKVFAPLDPADLVSYEGCQ